MSILWLGQYVRYNPAKSFDVWLQWDRNVFIHDCLVYIHHAQKVVNHLKNKGSLYTEDMFVHIKSIGHRSHLNPTALIGYHC